MSSPVKVMVYDSSTLEDGWDGLDEDGLALSWKWGDKLYRLFRSIDVTIAAPTLESALEQLVAVAQENTISEIQFWGHGSPGVFWVAKDSMSKGTILSNKYHRESWEKVIASLTSDALVWFRACSMFAGTKGREFGKFFADFINPGDTDRKVAAHTYIIGPWQSGLHTLSKGEEPSWPADEAIDEGTPGSMKKLKWSKPWLPKTITCLRSSFPSDW